MMQQQQQYTLPASQTAPLLCTDYTSALGTACLLVAEGGTGQKVGFKSAEGIYTLWIAPTAAATTLGVDGTTTVHAPDVPKQLLEADGVDDTPKSCANFCDRYEKCVLFIHDATFKTCDLRVGSYDPAIKASFTNVVLTATTNFVSTD